jgi:hypothetical protein
MIRSGSILPLRVGPRAQGTRLLVASLGVRWPFRASVWGPWGGEEGIQQLPRPALRHHKRLKARGHARRWPSRRADPDNVRRSGPRTCDVSPGDERTRRDAGGLVLLVSRDSGVIAAGTDCGR